MKTISLDMARQAGATRYFTGNPCKRGHVAERFVSTRTCVDCHTENQAAYRVSNPEAIAATEKRRHEKHREKRVAKAKKWQQAHPEKCREWAAIWSARNPERKREIFKAWRLANLGKVKADLKAWRAANPEHVRAKGLVYRNTRRAALLNRTPAWSDLKAIEEVYRDASEFRQAGIEVDVDHVIPLQGELVSGLHVPGNLRVLLSSVNRSKSNHFDVHI
jgi:hypothetical protein